LVEIGTISLVSESAQLTRIIGQTLAQVEEGEEIATPETCERFASILMQMQKEVATDRMQAAFNMLSPEAQNITNAAMEDFRANRCNVVTP
jgi:hypothetical protein